MGMNTPISVADLTDCINHTKKDNKVINSALILNIVHDFDIPMLNNTIKFYDRKQLETFVNTLNTICEYL